jgi:hypothetical protein
MKSNNFKSLVLLSVALQFAAKAESITLTNATADFSQPAFSTFPEYVPSLAIDGQLTNDVGWSIFPQTGQAHSFVVETVTDAGFPGGTDFLFKIYNLHLNPYHNLGRFRFSATTDFRSTFADGLAVGGDVTANWTVLPPSNAWSTNGTTFQINTDGSILATGPTPSTDIYMISCSTRLTGITGFRLEVLLDPSLPSGGPGRAPNGNFLLTELQVSATPSAPVLNIEVSEVRLSWASRTNFSYQLQYTPRSAPSQWTNLGLPIVGTGDEITLVDREVSAGVRLYRLIQSP